MVDVAMTGVLDPSAVAQMMVAPSWLTVGPYSGRTE